MLGAGLLAKKAVERGLHVKPWVKTSLAPGSKVVTNYLAAAGLTPYLEKLNFHLVGYGCTTCIGNSGPLSEPIGAAIKDNNLIAVAVLSGNRNFEGRIHRWFGPTIWLRRRSWLLCASGPHGRGPHDRAAWKRHRGQTGFPQGCLAVSAGD